MTDYRRRAATEDDRDWLYELHRAEMAAYLADTWGEWEEDYQRQRFDNDFDRRKGEIVVVGRDRVGCWNVERTMDRIHLSLIEIAFEYQGRGIGTSVVSDRIREAAGLNVPINLGVLRVNPARRLYERLGFSVTGESDTHYFMECPPPVRAPS